MKALRRVGIVDPRKSVHSLRHTVKQRLRDVGTPKDIETLYRVTRHRISRRSMVWALHSL
jgi:hypothetical protein